MTRPRSLAYRSLEVHRLEPAPPARRRVAACGAFALAMDRWRSAATTLPAAASDAEGAPVALPVPAPHDAQHDDAQHGHGQGSEPEGHEHGEAAANRPEPPEQEAADWVCSLVPTADTLRSVLDRVGPAPMPLEVVADVVARFCNENTVDHSEGWSVRMPLRADVLPDTTLELTLSTQWLQLRFLTCSAQARSHIADHQQRLHERLALLLHRRRGISIEVA